MKINKFLKIFGIMLFAGFASCEDEEQSYPEGVAKPIVSLSQTTFTGQEGQPVTITLNLDRQHSRAIDLKLEFVDDELFHDLVVTGATEASLDTGYGDLPAYVVTIPANVTTYSFTVMLPDNEMYDADQTYTLRLSTAGNLNGDLATGTETMFDVVFTNAVSPVLKLVFDWDATFTIGDAEYTLCDIGHDMDFFVYNDAGTMMGAAATAACPEELEFSFESYPDGVYDIVLNVWDDAGLADAGITPPFDIPVRVHYTRTGSENLGSGTFTQDAAYVVTSDFGSDQAGADLRYVVSVRVENGTYTLMNGSTDIVSGRTAAGKSVANNPRAVFNKPMKVKAVR